jgi:hypothetical protein
MSQKDNEIKSMIDWKGIQNTIRSQIKSCKSCQYKRHSQKYGIIPLLNTKLVVTRNDSLESTLGVRLIGQYTLKVKKQVHVPHLS